LKAKPDIVGPQPFGHSNQFEVVIVQYFYGFAHFDHLGMRVKRVFERRDNAGKLYVENGHVDWRTKSFNIKIELNGKERLTMILSSSNCVAFTNHSFCS
jgi:hypothetical protein